VFVADVCQLRVCVADGFMSTNHGLDGSFTFDLEPRHAGPRVAEFAYERFCFELSFRVLTGSTITFASQAFSLLSETLKRAFELARNFANTLSDCSLRKQFGTRVLDFRFGCGRAGEFRGVRLFSTSQF
jgi:hypothetical protein